MSERDYSVSQIPYGSFDEETEGTVAEETEGTVAEERELFDKLINVLNCYGCDVEKVVFYLKNGGKMTGLLIGQSWRMI